MTADPSAAPPRAATRSRARRAASPSSRARRAAVLALALLAGAFAVLLVACAAPAAPRAPGPDLLAARNEITALSTQIRDWRREAGMDVEPDHETVMAMARTTPATAARACVLPTPTPQVCTDVCDLAEAICDNAEAICGIAAELDNDAWATAKCDSAKASCREAQERCCDCHREVPPS